MSPKKERPSLPIIGLGIVVVAMALTGVGVAASGVTDKAHPASLQGGPTAVAASPTVAASNAAPPTASAPTPAGSSAPPRSSAPAATASATAASPGVTESAVARPSAKPTAKASAAGKTSARPRVSAKPGATAKASASTAPPAATNAPGAGAVAGSYPETTTGTVTYTGGSMPVNGTATLKVDPAQGQAQTQTVSSGNSSQVEKLVFGSDRVDATEISITSQIIDSDFVLSPQEPLVELTPGASWSWQAESTDGKEHLALTGSYAGTEQVTIDGRSETAAIIKSTLTLTGSIATTITLTDDYDPAYKLDIREHSVTKGTYDGINYDADTTTTLSSLTPS